MNISLFPKRNHLLSLDRLDTSVVSSVVWGHTTKRGRGAIFGKVLMNSIRAVNLPVILITKVLCVLL